MPTRRWSALMPLNTMIGPPTIFFILTYFVHQVDEDNAEEVFGKTGALDALYDLKREGKIGFTGIASHYYSVLLRAAMDKRVDVLQGSGNILERGMLERIRDLLEAFG